MVRAVKAVLGWLLVVALFVGLWFGCAPVRAANNACRVAGGEPWPTGCYTKLDVDTGKE